MCGAGTTPGNTCGAKDACKWYRAVSYPQLWGRKGNIRDWKWKGTLSLLGVEKAVLCISLYIFEVRNINQGGSQPIPSLCLLLFHYLTRKQNTPSVLKQKPWHGWDGPNSHLYELMVRSYTSPSQWNNTAPWLLLGKMGAVLEDLLFSFPLYPSLERNDSALYLVWGGRICPWASSLPLQVSMYLHLRGGSKPGAKGEVV